MSMTEEQMLTTLEDFARVQGGYLFHVRDSRHQKVSGLPDCIILIPPSWRVGNAHPGIVAFFEIKTQRDNPSALQLHVLAIIDQATEVVSGIIRPVPRNDQELTLNDALALLGKKED